MNFNKFVYCISCTCNYNKNIYEIERGFIMELTSVINQILVLFLIMFLGYFLNKIHIIDNHTNKKLSSLVVNVTSPALIISVMSSSMQKDTTSILGILGIVGLAVGVYSFLFIISFIVPLLMKIPRKDLGVYQFMILFSNVGFMGYPVMEAIYEKGTQQATTAIIYTSIFNLPFYFLIYTLGVLLISQHGGRNPKIEAKQFVNAGVIAVIIGLFFFISKSGLPMFLSETLKIIGGMTTPVSMIVIGASLANIAVKDVFGHYKIYILSIFKLIVVPLSIWLILRNIISDPILLGVCVVIPGMPIAANTVMLSNEYNGNEEVASKGVFLSTLLSIISIPILVNILS